MNRVMNPNLASMNLSLSISMIWVMVAEWIMKIAERVDGVFSSPDLIGGCWRWWTRNFVMVLLIAIWSSRKVIHLRRRCWRRVVRVPGTVAAHIVRPYCALSKPSAAPDDVCANGKSRFFLISSQSAPDRSLCTPSCKSHLKNKVSLLSRIRC